MSEDVHKWIWKMEYCRRNSRNPADPVIWSIAEKAYYDEQGKSRKDIDDAVRRTEDELRKGAV